AASRPATTSAMLIAYSSLPTRNSRVPSSGSTSAKLASGAIVAGWHAASSETTGIPGNSRDRPSAITASEASSAAVTGDWSGLIRVRSVEALIARIAAAARDATAVNPSMREVSMAGEMGCSRVGGRRLLQGLQIDKSHYNHKLENARSAPRPACQGLLRF